MSSAFPFHRHTFADYLSVEAESAVRHEFFDGEITAMAGGTPRHAALAAEVGRTIGNQVRGGRCRVFSSDLRIRVLETGLATYPDVTVVCGPTERDPESSTTVTNPTVIVEVTSDGTEAYDRGEKLRQYRLISTVRTIVLLSHRERHIEVWSRNDEDDPWTRAEARTGAQAKIRSIDAALDVDDIYQTADEPSS